VIDLVRLILLSLHFLGLALIVGAFFIQMRKKSDFAVTAVLTGAIAQVVTGLALVGVREASDLEVDHVKIAVKLGISLVVLVAAIVATIVQKRGGRVAPWFHVAGGLAVVNVFVAVIWR
jgi:hypothetical protein